MKEMIVKNEVLIDAPVSTTWNVLTQPQYTKQYMFGCETVSGWQPGSRLDWKGTWDGVEVTAVTGSIITIQPCHLLVYTTFDPNNTAIENIPENYLTVTYTLHAVDHSTHLIVTQGDYTKVANGQQRYDEAIAAGGWDSILQKIKEVAEAAV